jgi:YcaO-like protein with predicted kinase domain
MSGMGITRVANVTGLDSIDIPVVVVCRPNSRSLAVSQGKGLDLEAAKASALMESVEGYHAEHIDLPLKLGSYEELQRNYPMIDVTRLPRTADSRFHPHLPLLWIEGYNLLRHDSVWLPYEMVHLNFTLTRPTGSGCFLASSNGLASGNHVLEAISHGICEVVERDATTLWSLAGAEDQYFTRIDPNTVEDPSCREVLEKYEHAEIAVAIWEMTSDVGIPSFACRIIERTDNPWRLLYAAEGTGSHPLREIALLRALTEAAQSRLTMISGSRDDTDRAEYISVRDPGTLNRQRARMEVKGAMKNFQDGPTWDAETFNEDLNWQLARLQEVGIDQVVVVNLSKTGISLPVVRVVIPGLENMETAHDLRKPYVYGSRARTIKAGRS